MINPTLESHQPSGHMSQHLKALGLPCSSPRLGILIQDYICLQRVDFSVLGFVAAYETRSAHIPLQSSNLSFDLGFLKPVLDARNSPKMFVLPLLRPVGATLAWFALLQMATASEGPEAPDCKCIPGDDCWPTAQEWADFNATISGRLVTPPRPLAAVCHNPEYDQAACASIRARWTDPALQSVFFFVPFKIPSTPIPIKYQAPTVSTLRQCCSVAV